jgi:hypothetical protein
MPHFEVLGSLVVNLHHEFVRIYYLLLPIFFAISLVVGWAKNPAGGPDFLDSLRRAIVATLLLIAFQDVSHAIVTVADGIAARIDDMSGLNAVMQMAQEKVHTYSHAKYKLLLQFDDLFMAVLSFTSYLVLYFARYITVAMYYFCWIFLSIVSPLLLLFHIFPSTSSITGNLFRSMCEVASWKIVWATLSAMLTALSFGDIYKTEGDYLTLIVMNFVIAVAMLATPFVVRSLVGGGMSAVGPTLGAAAVATMAAAPLKVATAFRGTREVLSHTTGFAVQKVTALKSQISQNYPGVHEKSVNDPAQPIQPTQKEEDRKG